MSPVECGRLPVNAGLPNSEAREGLWLNSSTERSPGLFPRRVISTRQAKVLDKQNLLDFAQFHH
mgnify:CR=1 FL=1